MGQAQLEFRGYEQLGNEAHRVPPPRDIQSRAKSGQETDMMANGLSTVTELGCCITPSLKHRGGLDRRVLKSVINVNSF